MKIELMLILAGIGQICLVIGSIAIPKILGWKSELAKINSMLRHMFWVYAGYILMTNLSFGLLSAFAPSILVDGSTLACVVSGFMCAYWLSRLLIQFFYFDRADFPIGVKYKSGEILLVILFIFLSAVYGFAFYLNLTR